LAEKRIGFFLLTLGLVLYLSGLVLKSSEDLATMGLIAGGVVMVSLLLSLVFTRIVGNRIREQARQAREQKDPSALPEQ
jgi:peptidoglycan/LPS O-acetylase OafA/YrhL